MHTDAVMLNWFNYVVVATNLANRWRCGCCQTVAGTSRYVEDNAPRPI